MRRLWRLAAAACVATLAAGGSASAQISNWPSESPPRPLPARPSAFPPYEIRTLANGLQVVVVTHAEQPIISAQLLVKAGAAFDPPGKAGVANLVALLLDQGTTTKTAEQIADAVDSIGGELSVMAGTDVTFAQATVMKDSFGFGLGMLSDVIRNPAFSGEELERQRQQLRSGLKVSYEDPEYIASVVFDRLVFGFHPYGFPGEGTPDSVALLARDDLAEFHRRYYAPNNAILAIVGDVTSDAAFAAAEEVFGGWERREVTLPVIDDPPEPTRRVVVIDKPDAVQTEIRIGHIGIARNNKDYRAVDLGIRILGGEGANRLQQVLRTARGLTYGASADLEAYRLTGIIRAETDTRSQATATALRLAVDEFFKVQREVVETRELEEAKAYVTGSFPLDLETPGSISTKVLNALFHELPLKELETHRDLVNRVSPDDVNVAMRTYLRPDRLSIVLVGSAAFFAPALGNVGFKNVEIVPIGELDLAAAGFRRLRRDGALSGTLAQPTAPKMLASREDWERARAIVERAATAAGGVDALRSVKTLVASADTVLLTPGGPLLAKTRTFVQYPDRFRVDAKTPSGDMVQTYASGQAWIWDKRGARDAPDAMRQEFAASVRRDWIALLLAGIDQKVTGRRLDDETALAGRALNVVELWGDDLSPVRLAVDGATGRLERMSYKSLGPTGVETVTETFDDFRLVSGLLFPFKAVSRREDAPLLERVVTEVLINPQLKDGIFEKPR